MLTITFTIASVLSVLFAGKFQNYKWILQLMFICFATTAIQILIKYVLTRYEYICENNCLQIYKSVGRKSIMVGKFSLSDSASYIINEKEFILRDEIYNVKSTYTFTRNYKTCNTYIYVTTIGETNYMIKMELDEEFAAYVNDKIDKTLKGTDNNEI